MTSWRANFWQIVVRVESDSGVVGFGYGGGGYVVQECRTTYPPSSRAPSTSVAALMASTPTSTVTSMSSGFTPGKLTLTMTLSPSQTMSNGIDQSRRPEASDASVLALFSEEHEGNPAERRLARRRGHLISYIGSQRVNTISNRLLNAC